MEAKRLKAARSQLWRAWIFGGLLWSVVFLCLGLGLMGLLGVETTSYIGTLGMVAAVMAGGTYGILLLGALLIHTMKRLLRGQPLVDEK